MRRLLLLYPKSWRERYGDEFLEVLEARPPGIAGVIDVVRGALDARLRAHGAAGLKVALLLLGALTVGWLNYSATDDVQGVALALLVFSFVALLAHRARFWWPAFLFWIAVPLSGALADALGHHPGVSKPAPLYETVVALVFPLAGAALGAATRRGARFLRSG
jgi:hypothetical protein